MNGNGSLDALLADAVAQVYYWPLRYLAWLLWALIFAGLGMLAVRFLWKRRRLQAEELERENRKLRRELEDIEQQLRATDRSPGSPHLT